MSNSFFIREISSLEDLRIAILRFCEESEGNLVAINTEILSRIEQLKSLETLFLRNIESSEEELRIAIQALNNCNDEESNCSEEREFVHICRNRLEAANRNLNDYKREIKKIELAISNFQKPKVEFSQFLQFEREVATGSLKQLINGANDYISVSSTTNSFFTPSLGITETISKTDPTIVLTASVALIEVALMSVFYFLSIGGNLLAISNRTNRNVLESTLMDNGNEFVCSEVRFEQKETGNIGKILSVQIPAGLEEQKIAKHLINNIEANCRSNDCKEINGWVDQQNIPFYKECGYQTRNEVKNAGCEVYKLLDSDFLAKQTNAKAAFELVTNTSIKGDPNEGLQEVNPLSVLSPHEATDPKFWQQHGEDQLRYMDLIEKYEQCQIELKNGKSLDQIRIEDFWVANSYDLFHRSEPLHLQKVGNYYKIQGNGRHRIAAAQIYYLRTGKIVNLPAIVFER